MSPIETVPAVPASGLGDRAPLLLLFTAGFVDAVGFLSLGRVYVANMTGNTVDLGRALARVGSTTVVLPGVAVVFFVVGLLVSRFIARARLLRKHSHRVLALYGLECVLLVVWLLTALWTKQLSSVPALVALGALAMGVQNAAATHFGPLTTRTTHVTGLLAEMADRFAHGFESPHPERAAHLREGALLFLYWVSYCVGAVGGSSLFNHIGISCLGVAVGLLMLLIVYEVFWAERSRGDEPASK